MFAHPLQAPNFTRQAEWFRRHPKGREEYGKRVRVGREEDPQQPKLTRAGARRQGDQGRHAVGQEPRPRGEAAGAHPRQLNFRDARFHRGSKSRKVYR